MDDGTPCTFVASTPTIPNTEESNWSCFDHGREIQVINWPMDQQLVLVLMLDQATFDAKSWEKQFRDMLQAYVTASTAAGHLRAAICAFLQLGESPGDDELICQLNWMTAKQKRMVNNDN